MEAYEYPDCLYCEQCDQDVDTKIVERTGTYTNDLVTGTYKYMVAVCPICGHTLCERDKEFAFLTAIKQNTIEEWQAT